MELKKRDPEIARWIEKEEKRLSETLELIASENVVSRAVLEAAGSVLTNKYAEGYPGNRYYGGCYFIDQVEKLAVERAKALFGAEYANVQPHSGTQANMAVLLAVLKPGDRIMGMSLDAGGHLSHGSPASFSGCLFESHPYPVNRETELIDYQEVEELALKVRPRMLICGTSSYPRIIEFSTFRKIADKIGAYLLADIAHIAGLVVAGLHPTPVGFAHFITSTTHKTLRGPRGGLILAGKEYAHLLNRTIFPGIQGGPLMHIIAAKAVAFREAQRPSFKTYQRQVVKNCQRLAAGLITRGFRLVTGGTDTHLLLIDLTGKKITGAEAEELLEKVGISSNKNCIPFDRLGAKMTSGLRLGTPAVTTRGMKEEEMEIIAELINETIKNRTNLARLSAIKKKVKDLCRRFPLNARNPII